MTLIPVAMATYETVAVGVGKTHDSLTAGGCAAMLQSTAATLLTTIATAAVGATVGLVTTGTEKNVDKTK